MIIKEKMYVSKAILEKINTINTNHSLISAEDAKIIRMVQNKAKVDKIEYNKPHSGLGRYYGSKGSFQNLPRVWRELLMGINRY